MSVARLRTLYRVGCDEAQPTFEFDRNELVSHLPITHMIIQTILITAQSLTDAQIYPFFSVFLRNFYCISLCTFKPDSMCR